MAEFQEELGFPPAPKLDVFGKLDPSKATAAELRGQEVVFGKGQCGTCHAAPYYTDNLMHDLKTERGGHAGAGDAAHVLDDAMDRSVLVERPMSPQLVVIGGVLVQNPAQVYLAQDDHMVDAFRAGSIRLAFRRSRFAKAIPGQWACHGCPWLAADA
jgi:hypothetical protein